MIQIVKFNQNIMGILIHFIVLADNSGNVMLYQNSLNQIFYSRKEKDQIWLKLNQQLGLEQHSIEEYNQRDVQVPCDLGLLAMF